LFEELLEEEGTPPFANVVRLPETIEWRIRATEERTGFILATAELVIAWEPKIRRFGRFVRGVGSEPGRGILCLSFWGRESGERVVGVWLLDFICYRLIGWFVIFVV